VRRKLPFRSLATPAGKKPGGVLTYDGKHWNETGHRLVAAQTHKEIK
jgi:hypothetical protein